MWKISTFTYSLNNKKKKKTKNKMEKKKENITKKTDSISPTVGKRKYEYYMTLEDDKAFFFYVREVIP